jgi:hypothetical protein
MATTTQASKARGGLNAMLLRPRSFIAGPEEDRAGIDRIY